MYNPSKYNPYAAILENKASKLFKEYKARTSELNSWAISEETVRVHTQKYSFLILLVAITIILGTLSVPFLVGQRIKGVDPFQFVTFSWLLAGAFLIGAKSRYVEEWPWHDFLRGQILCRSVSELAAASRIKKQTVLLYLLHNEFKNPLLFRGPYHGAFTNRAGSGGKGFNIDVPLEHATALAAGFIVLKVWSESGEYLLLHDSRDDAFRDSQRGELFSEKLKGSQGRKTGEQELLKVKRSVFHYRQVVGQYIEECKFV